MKNKKNIKKDSNIFIKIISYINKNIFGISKSIIFELDLVKPGPKITSDLDLTFKLATKEDIKKMDKENYGYDKKGKIYSIYRLEKGDRCVLALYNDKIIAYIWIMKDTLELSKNNYIFLSKKRAGSYKGFCVKKYRGKRVHGTIYCNYLINLLRREGKRYVVSAVYTDNKSSLKAMQRLGNKIIGHMIHFNFFGLKYDYIKKKNLSYLQNS